MWAYCQSSKIHKEKNYGTRNKNIQIYNYVEDFIPYSVVDERNRQKFSKIEGLNKAINQLLLIVIYEILQSMTEHKAFS